MRVTAAQRFSQNNPCPVCGGHAGLPQGQGRRCFGFICDDAMSALCTRDEHAGAMPLNQAAQGYFHRYRGPLRCGCGTPHDLEGQRN